jgi:DNA modification methylase
MPTVETYNELIKHFNIDKLKGFTEYEELRTEYEELRRPFTPSNDNKMDVMRFSQEGHITGRYDHDTIKPEKLTRVLIQTCSRVGDLVVVPFAGSGTECAMSAKESRPFIGYEIEAKHVKTANDRTREHIMQTDIFSQGA